MGGNISAVEGIQYGGGIPSVLWGITAAHVGDSFSTVGILSVLWRLFSTVGDYISTVGNSFSTTEGIQYIGGSLSTVGITSVLWRYSVQWGILSVQWG